MQITSICSITLRCVVFQLIQTFQEIFLNEEVHVESNLKSIKKQKDMKQKKMKQEIPNEETVFLRPSRYSFD